MIATALTFFKNFSGPCLYLALAAGLFAAIPASCVTKKLTEGRAIKAEAALSDYRATVATQTVGAIQVALDGQRAAYAAEQARRDEIEAALAAIPDATAVQIEGLRRDLTKQLRTSLAAPEWACLRQPLPADVSSLFQRP